MFLFCGVLEHFFLHFTFPGICYNVKKYEDNPIFFSWTSYENSDANIPMSPLWALFAMRIV